MYTALFLWLIFYNVFDTKVPYVNYWDELFTAGILFCYLISLWKNPCRLSDEIKKWIPLALLVVLGLLGNICYPGLQKNPSAMIRDVVALIKFPAIFLALQGRSVSEEKQQQIICGAARISRWLIVITLFAAIAGRFVDMGFYWQDGDYKADDIYITNCFEFVFSHPTFFASAYVMLAAMLIAESMEKNRVYLLLDYVLLLLIQKVKSDAFCAAAILMLILGEKRTMNLVTGIFGSHNKKVRYSRLFLMIAAVGLVFVLVGRHKLHQYMIWGTQSARGALYLIGLRILVDFFPLGSGLGTFASHLSGRYYSELYHIYGIDNVNGLLPDDYSYISDVFWPYIYGQFGVFGLLIYLKMVFSLFLQQIQARIPDNRRLAVITVWIYGMIASTSEAYFTNGTGVQMALILTVFVGCFSASPKIPEIGNEDNITTMR